MWQIQAYQPLLSAILALRCPGFPCPEPLLGPFQQRRGQEPPGTAHLPGFCLQPLRLCTGAADAVDTKGIATNGAGF